MKQGFLKKAFHHKKKLAVIFALTAVISTALAASVFDSKIDVSAKTAVSDIFSTADVRMEEASTENGRSGLKLQGLKDGAYARIVDDISGNFSCELGFGKSNLKEITIDFEETNGDELFSVIAEKTDTGYNVSVKAFEKRAGIYYAKGVSVATSAEMNAQGVYTQADGEFLNLEFRPNEMQVWASGLLVWDFTLKNNAWAELDGIITPVFAYNASFVFENAERDQGVYLYELMGERLDTPILINRKGPSLFADVSKDAAVGKEYQIPVGFAYDLIDGRIEDVYVSLEKVKSYSEMTILSKKKIEREQSVTLLESGEYKLTYFATDSSGIENAQEYFFNAKNETEYSSFVVDQASFPEKIGKGSSVILPIVSYKDAIYKNETRLGKTLLTVEKDGNVLTGYAGVSVKENQLFCFSENGTYTFLYSVQEGGSQVFRIDFSVTDHLPKIDFPFVASEYILGEPFELNAVNAVLGDKTQNAVVALTYPEGETKTGASLNLVQYGLYTLIYRTQFGNRVYTFERNFETVDQVISISSEKEKNVAYTSSPYTLDRGVAFSLEANEVMRYNSIIDLTDKTAADTLIELYVTPQIDGRIETEMIDIVLTDVYDENNFITIRSYSAMNTPYNYVTAGVKNNNKVGDNDGVLQTWAGGGTPSVASHHGEKLNGKYYPISFSFDYQSGEIYTVGSSLSKMFVTDLTNADYHKEIFSGFSTGEVYLTVKLYSLSASSANFLLRSIDGNVLTDLYVLNTPDEFITVDTLGYNEDELPHAQVGKPYALFDGTCQEKDGKELLVSKRVYYHYGQADQTDIMIQDGAFVPQYAGEYTIVYTASTRSGKQVEKSISVRANLQATPVSVSLDETLENGKVGKRLALSEPVVEGGTGKTRTVVTYTSPSGEKGTAENYSFIPYEKGVYTVSYTVYDYIGKAYEQSIPVVIEENFEPQFEEEVELPKFLVNGKTYRLPMMNAIDYSSEIKNAAVALYVIEGKEKKELTDCNYTPNIMGGGTATVIYEAQGAQGENEISFEIPVKDISSINEFYEVEYNLEQFFIGEEIEVKANEANVALFSKGMNARFEYIYPLMAEGFTLKFNFDKNHSSAKAVSVWLTDSEDERISIKLEFSRKSDSESTSYVALNDGAKGESNGSMYGTGSDFNVRYDNAKRIVTDDLLYSYIISYTYDGVEFKGFPSGKVILRVEYQETSKADTAFLLKEINYQLFTNNKMDEVAPQIVVGASESKYITIGKTTKIPLAVAADVLDENVTFKVSGECNGKILKSVDGVLLQNASVKQYEIKFDEVGMYTFTYVASDRMGNTSRGYLTLNVVDTLPPVITVSGKAPSGKIGKAIEIPEATASDEGKSVEVTAVVVRPDQVIENIKNGKYTPKIEGKHTICYICVDDSGNVARVEVEFEVKGGR